MDSILSSSVVSQIIGRKVTWGNKAKHCWVITTNFLFSKVCWQPPAMFSLYTSSIIWIFTEGEGDGIESRLPFKIFSTLQCTYFSSFFKISKHSTSHPIFRYIFRNYWNPLPIRLSSTSTRISFQPLIFSRLDET